jgi:hypothetical protein
VTRVDDPSTRCEPGDKGVRRSDRRLAPTARIHRSSLSRLGMAMRSRPGTECDSTSNRQLEIGMVVSPPPSPPLCLCASMPWCRCRRFCFLLSAFCFLLSVFPLSTFRPLGAASRTIPRCVEPTTAVPETAFPPGHEGLTLPGPQPNITRTCGGTPARQRGFASRGKKDGAHKKDDQTNPRRGSGTSTFGPPIGNRQSTIGNRHGGLTRCGRTAYGAHDRI